MQVSICSPCSSAWFLSATLASTVQTPKSRTFLLWGDCAALTSAALPTYNFKFQHYVAQHVDASKLIFAAIFSRLLNHLLFILCFYMLSLSSKTSLPISFLFFIFPNLTSLLFSLYRRSRWMLRGFGCCSCPRGRPPPAPRPLGPGRLSTRFAFAPMGGSSCPRLAPDPPARSATTSASRTHTYKNKQTHPERETGWTDRCTHIACL